MKNTLRFKIDEKSLFYGEYNDFIRGQTATVATPLNQSRNEKKWRNDILSLINYNCRVDNPPEMLIYECKRGSHSGNNIDDVFVFEKFMLDDVPLEVDSQFVMYIKRETDEIITKLDGTKGPNTHLGRKKLHYPINIIYKADGYNIDNNKVLRAILEKNGGFAFVVRGFSYNQETKILNFITSLIGPEGVPLSTIFRRVKGVGKKLVIDPKKIVDVNYVVKVEEIPDLDNDDLAYEAVNKVRRENGRLGEKFVFELLQGYLGEDANLYHVSKDFPQSPYDIEYMENGVKKYVEVKSTSGDKEIFNMSLGELKFMNNYKDNYLLYIVTNVKDSFPSYKIYKYEDIINMEKEYPTTRFYGNKK